MPSEFYLPFTGEVQKEVSSERSMEWRLTVLSLSKPGSGCSFPGDCAEVIQKCKIIVEPAL